MAAQATPREVRRGTSVVNRIAEQSNGFIPLPPLRHDGSTAIGLWDLESAGAVMAAPDAGPHRARDQLVLARLHGQPLAYLHLELPPGAATREALLAAAWGAARDEITHHVRSCGCLPLPCDDRELGAVLKADPGLCPGLVAARPAGGAAVIVCTVGRPDALARTLRSLGQMACDDFEVIVVDNRPSEPATRAILESLASPVAIRYVVERRPGLAAARNRGVAAATDAAYVAFTDDDVVVDPHWLSWLLAPFAGARVQAVTGLVMPLRLGCVAEKRFEQYAGFGKGLREEAYDTAEHSAHERFLYPYWGGMFGSGNSMAFRRDALLQAGGFDPALGAGTPTGGGEDLAAFSDVILAGGQIVYQPRSVCWHEHRSDEQGLRTQVFNYGTGLTAVLWRYFRRDRRFTSTLLRSIPSMLRLARKRTGERRENRLPADLARIELRGRLLGPWRYMASSRRAQAGGPLPAGWAPAGSGGDQAGAQTRT